MGDRAAASSTVGHHYTVLPMRTVANAQGSGRRKHSNDHPGSLSSRDQSSQTHAKAGGHQDATYPVKSAPTNQGRFYMEDTEPWALKQVTMNPCCASLLPRAVLTPVTHTNKSLFLALSHSEMLVSIFPWPLKHGNATHWRHLH